MKKILLLSVILFLSAAGWAGVNGQLRQGGKFYKAQKYGSALNSYHEILKKNPLQEQALFNAGNAYYRLNEYTQAEDFYKKVAQQEGEYTQSALYNLGNAHYKAGHKEEAKEAFKSAILKDPSDKEAIHNLQLLLQQEQQENNQQNQNNQDQNSSNQGQQNQDQNQGQAPQQSSQTGKLSRQDAQKIMSMAKENEYKRPAGGQEKADETVEKDW